MAATIPHRFGRRFIWGGLLVGFSLGGFFDGILLHQVLQWHHLLSAVEVDAVRDLRAQMLADGIFHALMYVLGALGLWKLYAARSEFTGAAADRNLVANVLVGFGVWHVIDAVLSHWLTGIHRIRMDVPDPLLWDIGWLALFGLPPLIIGLMMKRRYPNDAPIRNRRRGNAHGLAMAVSALTIIGGAWSSLPPGGVQSPDTITVVLRPDVHAGDFMRSMKDSDARVLWSDRRGGVWVLTAASTVSAWDYYRHGAMYVSGSLLPAGCSDWIRVG